MGGECNYLLKVDNNYHLEFVEDKLWKSEDMFLWKEQDIQKLLDDAECALRSASARLHLPVEIVRKPRAVGAIPKEPTIYEASRINFRQSRVFWLFPFSCTALQE